MLRPSAPTAVEDVCKGRYDSLSLPLSLSCVFACSRHRVLSSRVSKILIPRFRSEERPQNTWSCLSG